MNAAQSTTIETPIRVYVGTQIEQMLAFEVLKYTIDKYASLPVVTVPLFKAIEEAKIVIPMPQKPEHRPRTPFSFQRFAIPALKGFKGRAIYIDSDMQVFNDIKEMWTTPFNGADLLNVAEPAGSKYKPQYSVMLMNCETLNWDVNKLIQGFDKGEYSYQEFMFDMCTAKSKAATLPQGWNDLERYSEGKTRLTHYTNMETQPWLDVSNPIGPVWCKDLIEAITKGAISRQFVVDEIEKGWIRPSLLYQIDHNIIDPRDLPKVLKRRDRMQYVPPHRFHSLLKNVADYGHVPSARGKFFRHSYASVQNLAFAVGRALGAGKS